MELSAVLSLKDRLSANMDKASGSIGRMTAQANAANEAIVAISKSRGIQVSATSNFEEMTQAARTTVDALKAEIEQKELLLQPMVGDIDSLSFQKIDSEIAAINDSLGKTGQSMEEIARAKEQLAQWSTIKMHYEDLMKAKTEVEVLEDSLKVIEGQNHAVRAFVEFKKDALKQVYDLDNKVLTLKTAISDKISPVIERIQSRVKPLRDKAVSVIMDAKDRASGAIEKVRQPLAKLGATVAYPVLKLKNLVSPVLSKVMTPLNEFAGRIFTATLALRDKATEALGKVVGGIGKASVAAMKAATASIVAGAVAVGALVGQSVSAFADKQQLVGGVETLFGAGGQSAEQYAQSVGASLDAVQGKYSALMNAQNTVLSNASAAYKTAGLSANAYMETVTSFSASLIASLGGDTEKAAQYADRAIVDMADNANKMGTDMASIQNAYQGFAKQNYTMLDNLKLGYGGTKEEMSRLLSDASKLSGIQYDISSFADVTEAIHVIQDSMGITGTTAMEAEKTISGSLASMKAAWGNTLASMATGGEELDTSIAALVDSAKVFASNIIPAIMGALQGVGTLIESLAPVISAEIPALISSVLPSLLGAATTIVQGLANAIPALISAVAPALVNGITQILDSLLGVLESGGPQIINTLVTSLSQAAASLVGMLPRLIQIGQELVISLMNGLSAQLPMLLEAAAGAIETLLGGIVEQFPLMMEAAIGLIGALAQGLIANLPALIPMAVQAILTVVNGLISAMPLLLDAALQIIIALANGLIQALPTLLAQAPVIISTFVGAIYGAIPQLISAAIQIVVSLVQYLLNNIGLLVQGGIQIIFALYQGVFSAIPSLLALIPELVSSIINIILDTNWLQVGWDLIRGIVTGVWEGAKSLVTGVWDGIKGLFGIGGKDSAKGATDALVSGLTEGAPNVNTAASYVAQGAVGSLAPNTGQIATFGAQAGSSLAAGITGSNGTVTQSAFTLAENTKASLAGVTQTEQIGASLSGNLAAGITANQGTAVTAASTLSSKVGSAANADVTVSVIANADSLQGFTGALQGVVSSASEILNQLPNAAQTAMEAMAQAFSAGSATILQSTTASMANVVNVVRRITLYSAGQNIMDGLNRGMLSRRSALIATAMNIASAISSTINKSLDINSPSRVTAKSGRFAAEGLAKGLHDMVGAVQRQAQRLSDAVRQPIEGEEDSKASGGNEYGNLLSAVPIGSGETIANSTASSVTNVGGNKKQVIIQNLIGQVTVRDSADENRLVEKIIARLADEVEETEGNMGEDDFD